MKQLEQIFGKLPNEISNAFSLKYISGIHIHANKSIFSDGFSYSANVEFKRNNTKATQHIEGDNLTDVFMKVMNFCKRLDNDNT